MKILRLMCFLLMFSSLIAEEAPRTKSEQFWHKDYQTAVNIAKEQNKVLLIAFVGVDWCPWSKKLYQDVLSEIQFVKALDKEVVFVWVNFPEQYVKVKSGDQGFEKLKNRFDISQLPTLVLATADEERMAVLNYLPLKPSEFADHIKSMLASYQELSYHKKNNSFAKLDEAKLESLYKTAEKMGCSQFQDVIMEVGLNIQPGLFFLLERYAQVIDGNKKQREIAKTIREQIVERDPGNEQGFLLKLAVLEFEKIASHLKENEDPHLAVEPLLNYIKEFGKKDTENLWRIEMMVAKYMFSKEQLPLALKHAEASYEVAPKHVKAEIKGSLEYIRTNLSKK